MPISRFLKIESDHIRRCCAWLTALLCGSLLCTSISEVTAQGRIPNFSPDANTAWQSNSRYGLDAAPSGPQPVGPDPAIFKDRPYNMDFDFPVLDVSNPNLQPPIAQRLRAQNERVLSGRPFQPITSSCWPHGLPAYMRYNGPTFIVQGPNEVVILKNQSSELRRIALNQPHSAQPKPSWYGESVGHYENGDTLVIDTIGFNDRTYLDLWGTPHTTALHVIERWTLSADLREIDLQVRVEDAGTFKAPYELTKHYRRAEANWTEAICAENPIGPLGARPQGLEPMPQDDTPVFR
jgi:hypothetical protein